jgi:MFS transporter, SP family, solute carrier family 2 (myo-inositol transporter), member 13
MTHDVQRIDNGQNSELEQVEMQPLTTNDNDAGAPDEPLITNAQRSGDDGDGNGDVSEQHAPQSYSSVFVYGLTVSAGVSGLLFGYDTGVISSTLVSVNTDLSSRLLTSFDKGLITSSTSLFALIASPLAGILADRYGRRKVILIADALFTLGALWQAVTTTVWGMILGRSIVGLAIGGASLIVPLYISELSPSHLRGRLVTVSITFVTGGQVVAYLIGWLFSTLPSGWRWMVGLGALPAIIQFFALVFMPETPRWLVQAEHEDEARKVLRKVFGSISGSAEHILRAIKNEILEEEEARLRVKRSPSRTFLGPTLSSLLLSPPHARALTIACLLQGLQQLCGFNSLMYFSASIFTLLRFASPTLTSMSIASANFVFTLAAFYLIDRVGRRRMLLYTIPMMAIALLLCAFAFHFVQLPRSSGTSAVDNHNPFSQSRLPAIAILISLVLYVSTYATGMGPVPCRLPCSTEVLRKR